jgi:hypothetical protein
MPTASILQLVAALAERAPSVSANLVRTAGLATRSKEHGHLNALVADLSVQQREQLALLLQHERNASLYDALVALQEQVVSAGWVVSAEGHALELEPNGYTLGEEFITQVSA